MTRNFKLNRILSLLFAGLCLSAQVVGDSWELKASEQYPTYIDVTWKMADPKIDKITIYRAKSPRIASLQKEVPPPPPLDPRAYSSQRTVSSKDLQFNDSYDLDAQHYYHYQIRAASTGKILAKPATGFIFITTATGHLSNVEPVCPSDLSLDSAQLVRSGACELVFRYECPKPKTTNAYLVKVDHTMLPLKILSQNASRLQVKVPRDWQKYQFWKVAMDGKMDSLSIQK